ncbi:hypothetical protein [Hansschlegelia zhihuaiae]|uniref:XRE family transcriptional regulator n=1 Tax=Hansschlegelia zhihuaiae TaxID=405005 RepID=A0A4Q0M3P8_9HYPH|nr:hypothetical protein [Hansschlegelia zhihuaiae]RXF67558.1 hypothetical protein EK403_21235 [Hansschlegelia zhihuaiae]
MNFPKVGGAQIEVADGVCAFLRARYPDKTAANVHADTGIRVKTVEKWLAKVSAPGAAHLVVLVTVYGPEFLCAVTRDPPPWLTAAGRAARRAEVTAQIDELVAELEDGRA